jgi:hypothetical protein|tara:strand:- start:619 stop:1401 length:783 start_codon:yes stop_codon:yes gene_type:complete
LKHFVYGNGESRKGFKVSNYGGVSWGCNAIYRDTPVDNLVVVDYGMQGEVYDSDYVKQYKCWFTDWNPVPSDPFMLESFNHDFKEEDRHTYGFDLGTCVINGSHETVVNNKINLIKKGFPHLDPDDLELKVKKDLGLHIIYNNESKDLIVPIYNPRDWSAGSTAVNLACQNGASEVYMFGFDFSSYDDSINNIYKDSKNYLPSTARGFNPINWRFQLHKTFGEYSDVKFNWVGHKHDIVDTAKRLDNVNLLTYDNIGDIR